MGCSVLVKDVVVWLEGREVFCKGIGDEEGF